MQALLTELLSAEEIVFLRDVVKTGTSQRLHLGLLDSAERSIDLVKAIVLLMGEDQNNKTLAETTVSQAFAELGLDNRDREQSDLVRVEKFWAAWENISLLWEQGLAKEGGVPWQAAWLSAESVETCFKKSLLISSDNGTANVTVVGISVDQIGQGVGIASDMYRVQITYANIDRTLPAHAKLPSSMVTKITPPGTPPATRVQDKFRRTWFNEYKFYKDMRQSLVDEVGMTLAEMYYGAYDPQLERCVLMLEDLGGENGYANIDQLVGCTKDEAVESVVQLARMQGFFWNRTTELASWVRPFFTGMHTGVGACTR
jgi:hypothetical protein